MIGEIVSGRYGIVRKLGMGGMGAVFEAEDVITGQRVALKVISTGDAAKDKALIGRFQREAKAASSIDTDHIVRVLDTGMDPATGQPFMAMELLDGEDLQQLFKRLGKLPSDLALRLMTQACAGLERAHEARVVHRDIKPANLFLARLAGGERIVKILDFGIAKIKMDQALAMETTGLTRTGSMLGSPAYMSPEQARGAKTIDQRADLWSLGVVLYQALSGRTPYSDIDALGELIIAICSELPRPIQEIAPWVPPEIASIVHRALRLDPGERYQSASEMLQAMRDAVGGEPVLHDAMLVALSPDEAERVKERIEIAPLAMRVTTRGGTGTTPPPATGTISTKDGISVASSGVSTESERSVPDSAATTGAGEPRRRAPFVAIGASLAAALAVAGIAYKLAATPAPPPASKAQSAEGATAASVAPPPTSSPSNDGPALKTVKLVVSPPDAAVEVDGVTATVTDGSVAIVGALGSVHHVRATKGATQTTTDVVVTEAGAKPGKIEIEAPAAKAQKSAQRAPSAVATAAQALPPAPVKAAEVPAPTPGLKEKFE